jgi:hypothetical protein
MPIVDYVPFANTSSANVRTQSQFLTDLAPPNSLANGFQLGLARSDQMNKLWRQHSMIAACVANFIANTLAIDVLDDGNVPALVVNFTNSVLALANANGQCRLVYVDPTHIKLALLNGNRMKIGGLSIALPSGGVSATNAGVYVSGVAGQNLVPNTRYLVACFMQGATPVLSYWPTPTYSHAPDTTAGNVGTEVIVGQPGHSLVGSVYTDSSGRFTPDNGLGGTPAPVNGVLSWFNRRTVSLCSSNSSVAFSSTANSEISQTLRATFQCWGDESILVIADGTRYNNPSGLNASDFLQIAVDGIADLGSYGGGYVSATATQSGQFESSFNGIIGEGLHYATLYGAVTPGSVGTIDQGYTRVHLRG